MPSGEISGFSKGVIVLNKQEAIREVKNNILPFWQGMADEETGGFYGEADFYGSPNKTAAKGCILNSRILWTFSAAYRIFGDDAYKSSAQQARDFLTSRIASCLFSIRPFFNPPL
jgi:mannose/cellobiose epimerase-like protein (N-acyl-D-glucosamine 2-epimerase family)